MEPLFELGIHLPPRGSRQRLRELYAQLKQAVLEGRLKPGLRLPATRALAQKLGVSRNTVVAAYESLAGEGYITARPGAGNYIADLRLRPNKVTSSQQPAGEHRLSVTARALDELAPVRAPRSKFDFAVGLPDTRNLRFDVWNRLFARRLRTLSRRQLGYGAVQGQRRLREAIAGHVSFARAVACSAESIVVTVGAQQAFDLLARILVTPGKSVVAIENPGYAPARAAFAAAGAKIVPVRVDEEGLVVERLPLKADIVFVTPAHQFPLGCVLSARRRAALLAFAHKHGAVVIEDDYDGEFRYGGRPLDALQTLDRYESVFFVGTFSKSLFPGLRVGYVVAPAWALPALIAAKNRADLHNDLFSQETLAAFISEGHLARHVRKMRRVYAARRDLLLDTLQRDFALWLTPIPSAAGLHLTAFAQPAIDIQSVAAGAREVEVGLDTLPGFAYANASKRPQALMFGYGAIDETSMQEGLIRLRRVLARVSDKRRK